MFAQSAESVTEALRVASPTLLTKLGRDLLSTLSDNADSTLARVDHICESARQDREIKLSKELEFLCLVSQVRKGDQKLPQLLQATRGFSPES
jgi:hypothetical protein